MSHIPTLVALCAVVVFQHQVVAQGGQGASARSGEAMQLLRSGPLTVDPGEPVEILEGAPETFPGQLLPRSATATLSSVSPSMTVVVATIKSGEPFNQARFEWQLEDGGWTSTTAFMRGFSSGVTQLRVCHGDDFASLQFRTTPSGDRLVRVALAKEPMRSCAPVGSRNFTDVPIPSLAPPAGVRYTGGSGSGAGLDEMNSRTRFETTMTIDALMTHFVPQFAEYGWTLESGPMGDGVMSTARFSGASRAGDAVTAQLILTALPGTPFVDAIARFVRHKPVRIS